MNLSRVICVVVPGGVSALPGLGGGARGEPQQPVRNHPLAARDVFGRTGLTEPAAMSSSMRVEPMINESVDARGDQGGIGSTILSPPHAHQRFFVRSWRKAASEKRETVEAPRQTLGGIVKKEDAGQLSDGVEPTESLSGEALKRRERPVSPNAELNPCRFESCRAQKAFFLEGRRP